MKTFLISDALVERLFAHLVKQPWGDVDRMVRELSALRPAPETQPAPATPPPGAASLDA